MDKNGLDRSLKNKILFLRKRQICKWIKTLHKVVRARKCISTIWGPVDSGFVVFWLLWQFITTKRVNSREKFVTDDITKITLSRLFLDISFFARVCVKSCTISDLNQNWWMCVYDPGGWFWSFLFILCCIERRTASVKFVTLKKEAFLFWICHDITNQTLSWKLQTSSSAFTYLRWFSTWTLWNLIQTSVRKVQILIS